MIKQLLCLLLVLSLLIPFASCSDTAPDAVTADESETTAETEPDDTRVYPELPDYDAEGATVTVVNIDYSIPIWAQRDIWAEEITGEIYDFGGIGSDLIYMTMTYDRDMASTYAKKEKQIAKEIEKTIKKFTEG